MRISTTERQLYKRCRRRWDYASYNRQSLSPIINAPALDLGTLVHATLAAWTQDPALDPKQYYTSLSTQHFQQVINAYKERIGCAPSESELQPTQEAIMLGLGMISNYKDRWHSALPPGFTLIENELTLIQDVQGTEHCKCYSEPVPHESNCPCDRCIYYTDYNAYAGTGSDMCRNCACVEMNQLECTFDGVMADESGDLYIIERKTFSRTPQIDELNNNDQFLAYQWALSNKLPNVVGVAYDGLLKRLKPVAGKTYDDLFLRRILLRNKHELTEFQTLLALELNEMVSPTTPIYKNVPFMGCQRWECAYLDVCHATSKGEPTEHLLKMFQVSTRKKHLDTVEAEV